MAFSVTAHGARTMLHLSGWAPGTGIRDLSDQEVRIAVSGPDAAVDGRFLDGVAIRFGRVTDRRAVLSLDAEAEALDPASDARALLEADIRCDVEAAETRHHCLGCGRDLEPHARLYEEYIGGSRVRLRRVPPLCPDCAGRVDRPAFCGVCGDPVDPASSRVSAGGGVVGYTTRCPAGHVVSGRIREGTA